MKAFAIGSLPKESRDQKKDRLRKEAVWKRKEQRHNQRKTCKLGTSKSKQSSWRIIPSRACGGFAFWMDFLQGETLVKKHLHLFETMEVMKKEVKTTKPWKFPPTTLRQEYIKSTKKLLRYLAMNQAFRWNCKSFFTKARILRFRSLNDRDPITLEEFKQPVYMYSFSNRIVYTFEAFHMARHIHRALMTHNSLIPAPFLAKNPFTNEVFSIPLFIFILQQCKRYGHTTWAIEAFIACRYNLDSFMRLHTKALRINALRTTMANVDSYDAVDILYDFIESQHDEHHSVFSSVTYKWAIHHAPYENRLEKWRRLCLQWYEVDILQDDPTVRVEEWNRIQTQTKALCERPHDLHLLRLANIPSRR